MMMFIMLFMFCTHLFFIELEIPTQFWFLWMLMILFDLFSAQFAWRQDKLWLYVSQWKCPQLYGIDWINFYFINSWEMSHHNDQYWNIRVVILRQCMLHCVASYLHIFTPHRLGCQRLKYILVFVSTTYQIIYVVSYRHRFPMHCQWGYGIIHCQKLHYINNNIDIILIKTTFYKIVKNITWQSSSMEVVIDKFSIFVSPNRHNFASGSKHLLHSWLSMIDHIMALKDHFGYEYVHGNRLSGQ